MFELTEKEWLKIKNSVNYNEKHFLRSQFVTLENGTRGQYSKYKPFVFTEQGVAMLSSVINNLEAAQMDSNDHITQIYQIIKELIEPAIKNRPPVGFKIPKKDSGNPY